jgi:flagellar motor switch protein FliN/FliY
MTTETPDPNRRSLGLLANVDTEVTVVVGRARLPIRDLLTLVPGAVIELDRKPSDPVEVLVNGSLIARGEVVVVDGEFGVRITEIVDPGDLGSL